MDDNMNDVELPDVAVVAGNGHYSAATGAETARVLSHATGMEAARVVGPGALPTERTGASAYGMTQQTPEGIAPVADRETNGTSLHNGNSPSLFWNSSLTEQEELNWFVPPLPHSEKADAPTAEMLEQFGQMLPQQPKRAWMLKWNYRTRSAATAAEQAHVEQEAQGQFAQVKAQAEREIQRIDVDVKRLNAQQQELEQNLLRAQNAFAESAARAGLHCEMSEPAPVVTPARSRRGRREEAEKINNSLVAEPVGRINPQVVEDALNDAVPTLQEMAGEYGVGPVGHTDTLARILSFFMQFLAPLVAGMMLALCLGTLVGILDIDTLQRSDSAPQLALSGALGFVIVYLMGELFHTAVATLARSLETRDVDMAHKPNVPRFRSNMGIAVVLIVVALGLGVAEVTAEGLGIRQLHQQQIARQNRFKGSPAGNSSPTANARPNGGAQPVAPVSAPVSEELPLIVYLVIGTLISGPYLAYKTARGWGENETHLREAWLTHRQRVWLDERRAQPDVQMAFHHAYTVEQIESNLNRTRWQLQNLEEQRTRALNVELPVGLQTRRREARAAAVGEAARLQQSIEDLIDVHEPLPRAGQQMHSSQAGMSQRQGANGASLHPSSLPNYGQEPNQFDWSGSRSPRAQG